MTAGTETSHVAAGDCERPRGRLGQPVNTATSLAMVAIGAWETHRASRPRGAGRAHGTGRSAAAPRARGAFRPGDVEGRLAGGGRVGAGRAGEVRRALGWSLVAAGIGSAAYHGPGGRVGHWLHDVTLVGPPVALAAAAAAERRGWTGTRTGAVAGAALAGAGALRATGPRAGVLLGVAAAGCVGSAVTTVGAARAGTGHLGAAALTGAAGVVVFTRSRTGEPWCRPDGLLQGHGLWHLLVAAAAVLAGRGLDPGRR